MAKIIEKKKSPGWKDRHIEVKRYKNNTKRTWMHLVIGENRITNEKVLRLLKPFNYFSIPDKETYKKIKTGVFTFPSDMNPTPSFKQVILSCLEKEPHLRPTSM